MSDERIRFAEQRHEYVLDQLAAHGRVEASRLAHELSISMESVRKDLALLEDRGLLRRVHGGAIPVRRLTVEPAVHERTSYAAEKLAIARAALAHLPGAGGSIIIDAGSTTSQFAELLPADQELTVCTNALPIASALALKPSVSLWLLGGSIRPATLATVGEQALRELGSINVEVAFLGTNGLSLTRGLTTPDPDEAAVKAAMAHAAARRILLADHSKIGEVRLRRHLSLSDVDLLITDAGIAAADLDDLRAAGLDVEIAS